MRQPTVPPTAGLPHYSSATSGLRVAARQDGWLPGWAWRRCNSNAPGTSALMVALRSLQALSPGRSEVAAPAYTCPLVALAIAQCGLQLRLCDLRADALDMDPVCLAAPVQRPDRCAVLPTHLCGRGR